MPLLDLFRRKSHATEESATDKPQRWFLNWLTGGETASGERVNYETAQRTSAVFACVQVRSEDLAKLPLILYRRRKDGRGRDRATDHPLYQLVGTQPNPHMDSLQWREMAQGILDLRGNSFSLIERDGRGRPISLTPLHPSWCTPLKTSTGDMFYDVRMYGKGPMIRYSSEYILHLRDRSEDGFIGKSRITQARESIGLALASEKHGAHLLRNGARPSGIISLPNKVGKAGRDLIKAEFENEFGGANQYSVGVISEAGEYKPIGMTQQDAQYIESRKFQILEIARIFRVPPHKIGALDNATFSNIEHQAIEYVTDTMLSICRRWECSLNAALLSEKEQGEYYFEFLLDALLRGDFKTRMDGYSVGRLAGIFSANECRERENMNSYDGGDAYLEPLNYWPVGTPRPESTAAATAPKPKKSRSKSGEANAENAR